MPPLACGTPFLKIVKFAVICFHKFAKGCLWNLTIFTKFGMINNFDQRKYLYEKFEVSLDIARNLQKGPFNTKPNNRDSV